MLMLPPAVKIFLCLRTVDMRKSFAGLADIVRSEFGQEPMNGHLFVFVGKRSDRIKILWWDKDGWALFYKRLEKGTFRLPQYDNVNQVQIPAADLTLMLDGIDLRNARRQKRWHPKNLQIS